MDKIKLKGGSKTMLFAVLMLMVLLVSGCETAKGFATGIGSTAEGVGKDSYNLWNFLKSADNWLDKNLW